MSRSPLKINPQELYPGIIAEDFASAPTRPVATPAEIGQEVLDLLHAGKIPSCGVSGDRHLEITD